MRGDANPASARQNLTPSATRPAAVAGVALLLAALLTGGAHSPFALLLPLTIVLFAPGGDARLVLAFPAAAATLLLGVTAWRNDVDASAIVVASAVTLSTVPGLLWRRERKRMQTRLRRLQAIETRADQIESASMRMAADELDDLERALFSIAGPLGATAVTLWSVDAHGDYAQPLIATSAASLGPVRLKGDVLGWAWLEGLRMRLDPVPAWAPPRAVVVAERLRRAEGGGELVSYEFAADQALPSDALLDQSAVYLRGVLALHEARAAAMSGERRVHALMSGLQRIPGELELTSLAQDLCSTAIAVTGATGAAVGVWEGEHGELLAAQSEDGGPTPGARFELPVSELALAVRADTMLIRRSEDWSLRRTAVANADERWQRRPRSLAALPLRGAGGAIGVLAVWSSRTGALDEAALELLRLLSPYAAMHLEHARAFGHLRETAERDPLTQLRNRRAFDSALAGEVVRFERYPRPLALMILDLDHFKGINDRYGHEAGDEVLRRVARLMAASVRDADTAARLGGEEFVVLMPETTLEAAAAVAERVRAAVGTLAIDWRGARIPVSVSIGVSAAPARAAHPTDLLRSADAALYRAKASGRDRVITA